MRVLVRRILSVITLVVATAALTTVPASAEPSPPGCAKGNFCVYSGVNQTGTLLLSSAGNWSGTLYDPGSIFNNGWVYPGYDHIQVSWFDHGNYNTRCIHYNPGPGQYKMNFGTSATLIGVYWRGEC